MQLFIIFGVPAKFAKQFYPDLSTKDSCILRFYTYCANKKLHVIVNDILNDEDRKILRYWRNHRNPRNGAKEYFWPSLEKAMEGREIEYESEDERFTAGFVLSEWANTISLSSMRQQGQNTSGDEGEQQSELDVSPSLLPESRLAYHAPPSTTGRQTIQSREFSTELLQQGYEQFQRASREREEERSRRTGTSTGYGVARPFDEDSA